MLAQKPIPGLPQGRIAPFLPQFNVMPFLSQQRSNIYLYNCSVEFRMFAMLCDIRFYFLVIEVILLHNCNFIVHFIVILLLLVVWRLFQVFYKCRVGLCQTHTFKGMHRQYVRTYCVRFHFLFDSTLFFLFLVFLL